MWRNRNSRLFDPRKPTLSPQRCTELAAEFFYLGVRPRVFKPPCQQINQWLPPPHGFFKLNTDGGAKGNPGIAVGGGLIRDHNGSFIKGFSHQIGITSSLVAEFVALRDGLSMADCFCLYPLLVEVDATSIISLVEGNSPFHPLNPIISDCRFLLKKLKVDSIRHIPKESNQTVIVWLSLAIIFPLLLCIMTWPPRGLLLVFLLICTGLDQ